MTNALGAKPVVNTNDFKSGLSKMNADLRVLESGFRASTASMGSWAQTGTGLELRIKTLNSQMEIQRGKVAALKTEYERIRQEKGNDAIATAKAEEAYNKSVETLGKMQNELTNTETALTEMGDETETTGKSTEEMGDKVEKSGNKVEVFKSILGGVGAVAKAAVAGIVAVGVGAIAAIGMMAGLGFKAAETADNLADMSVKTGISTTRLQELAYAGKILGTDLDTITGANARLIRSMNEARDGTGSQADAFKTLGVPVVDLKGKLLDSQVVMGQVFDKLQAISNPAERDALAMALFGKSAQELNPLIAAGSKGMADMADQAHRMGAVISEEDVAAGASFQDTLDGLKMGFQGVLSQIGVAFIPAMSGIAGQAQGYLQELVGVVQGSGGDITKMISGFWTINPETGQAERNAGIMGIVTGIIQDLTAQLPQLASVALNIVQTLLKAITGALPTLLPLISTLLPQLAAVGLDIMQSLLTAITGALPMLLTAAVSIITSLVGFLVQNLPLIMSTAVQLLLALVMALITNLPMLIGAAFQMIITLVQGIAAALPTLIPAIVEMLVLIITTIIENLPMLLEAALQLILGLVQGLAAALPILIAAVPTILIAIVDTLTAMLPVLVEMAPEIIVALISGIIGALPALGEAIPQIIETIISVITELIPDILDAGVAILTGIWEGIQAQLPWFWEKIKTFALSIWTAITDALGISSPSELFASTVGPNIPAGIWEGIAAGMPDLERKLAAAMTGLSANLTVGGAFSPAFAGAGAAGGNTYIEVNIPVTPIAGDVDVEKLAYRVAYEISRRQ